MSKADLLLLAADGILIVHVLLVAFIVGGLALIFIGKFANWAWVRNIRFRIVHLAAITIVVVQSWVGVLCPLTTWESALRERAGAVTYAGSFIQHWLHSLLYYSAPEWVFIVVYTAFGALVVISWFVVRPDSGKH